MIGFKKIPSIQKGASRYTKRSVIGIRKGAFKKVSEREQSDIRKGADGIRKGAFLFSIRKGAKKYTKRSVSI